MKDEETTNPETEEALAAALDGEETAPAAEVPPAAATAPETPAEAPAEAAKATPEAEATKPAEETPAAEVKPTTEEEAKPKEELLPGEEPLEKPPVPYRRFEVMYGRAKQAEERVEQLHGDLNACFQDPAQIGRINPDFDRVLSKYYTGLARKEFEAEQAALAEMDPNDPEYLLKVAEARMERRLASERQQQERGEQERRRQASIDQDVADLRDTYRGITDDQVRNVIAFAGKNRLGSLVAAADLMTRDSDIKKARKEGYDQGLAEGKKAVTGDLARTVNAPVRAGGTEAGKVVETDPEKMNPKQRAAYEDALAEALG
ncbi:MAG: hypothetical protein V2A77_02515 [Pseudomonadota bacterium]